MDYKKRIKLLKFIGQVMNTSDESRKYIYELIHNLPKDKLSPSKLSQHLINIEQKYTHNVLSLNAYSTQNLELLLEAINTCSNKEKNGNLIQIILNLVEVGSKYGILSKYKVIANKEEFQIESSKGLFGKSSQSVSSAMLEYVISNGANKKNSNGEIPSGAVDSLIESALEFNSSKNPHDKFLQTCGKSSIGSKQDMESALEDTYNIKNKIPSYIIDLAYSISLGKLVISRNERLVISYENTQNQKVRANMDAWDYKAFMNTLLRGENIGYAIDSFSNNTLKQE